MPLSATARVSGSGVEKIETRNVGAFTKIETSGAITLQVTAGQSATAVVVSGDDNVVTILKTTVTGDVLRIKAAESYNNKLLLLVKIGMPRLIAIDASGATKISVSNIDGERFDLEASGATTATLGGKVGKFSVSVSGAGRVDAGALAAKNADVSVSGAGKVEVNASDKLAVEISGAGTVIYAGSPVITKSISGVGKVSKK